jgi:hypothetical protein
MVKKSLTQRHGVSQSSRRKIKIQGLRELKTPFPPLCLPLCLSELRVWFSSSISIEEEAHTKALRHKERGRGEMERDLK